MLSAVPIDIFIDCDLSNHTLPLALGHEIVGIVAAISPDVKSCQLKEHLRVSWLVSADGVCKSCLQGQENFCNNALCTSYHTYTYGGFAEYALADERYCFHFPQTYNHAQVAPLLCAGLIGHLTYRLVGEDVEKLGIYGFGAVAQIIPQLAKFEKNKVYSFTRPSDMAAQEFTVCYGANWSGDFIVHIQPPISWTLP